MENGVTGETGATVPPIVEVESNQGLGLATIQLPRMVVMIASEKRRKVDIVILLIVQVTETDPFKTSFRYHIIDSYPLLTV